jgi:lipid-binding SYLF domain-containing protein
MAIVTVALAATLFVGPAAAADRYDVGQIQYLTKSMGEKIDLPVEDLRNLMVSLDMAVKNDWFAAQMKNGRCDGVFVFSAGKGGFVVSYMEGDGLVSFAGGRQNGPITLKSWSIGAQAGGEALWGVGLIMNLRKTADFGGEYRGKAQSATAGEASTYNWQVYYKSEDAGGLKAHQIFLLQQGKGFNAGVAAEKINITTVW